VLDATFSTAAGVCAGQTLAAHPRAIFLAIECRCSPAVARTRIVSRANAGGDASEVRPEVLEKQLGRWEPWPTALPQVQIDTEQPLAEQVQAVMTELSRSVTAEAN
jgi:predicted kinase